MARKSLGTLTLDLIARVAGFEQGMDKAERKSRKTAKQIERYSAQIGAALTAGTAAAVTGMAALVASTSEGARETKNLAALSNATTKEFQRGAYAVKRYGFETEKYADILKDVNDRVGDFIQTGGGPMADFFENIAPMVGVTADQFARLSGPQALQLYVDSLEAAGASQQEMTFYMEAIASDASALIPLLRDNGKEMKALGDEAERTGNVFSEMDFQQLESVRRGMDELTGAATGMKNEVVMAAIPAIEDLVELLSDEDTLESAQALGSAVVTSMNFVIEAVDGAVKVTRFLAEELAAFIHGPALDDLPRLSEQLEKQRKLVDNLRLASKNRMTAPPPEDVKRQEEKLKRLQDEYDLAVKLREEAAKSGPSVTGTGVSTVTPTAVGGTGYSPGEGTGLSARDRELQDQLQQRLSIIRQAFETENQAVLRTYKERNEEIKALEAESVISAMESSYLRYQNELERGEQLRELRERQLEDEKGYWQRWIEAAETNLQSFDDLSKTVIDNFTTGFGNAFESVIFDAQTLDDAFKGIAETILRSVVNALGQLAAQWIALQAVQAVTGTSATAATVGQAAIASAAWAPAAAAASLATLGTNAAPAAGALASTHALSKTLSLTGMAHDGIDSVPREGTWLLDEGERVLTSPQADSLDAFLARQEAGGSSGTTVNVIEDSSRAGQTETRRGSNGEEEVNVFVADIMGGGRRAQAIQTVFGLRRQGN